MAGSRGESNMINFNSSKTRRKIAAVIIIVLVVAMILPVVLELVM